MIDVRELRLGNWIMVAGTGELHPAQINTHNLRQLLYAPEYGAAIPLTPEILEQFQFALRHGILTHKYYENNGVELDFLDGYWRRVMVTQFCTYRFNEIKYLHQLQNLFFALTGGELHNINDKTFEFYSTWEE